MATAKKTAAAEAEQLEDPAPDPEPVDEGTVCEVCGRRGRAEGHH